MEFQILALQGRILMMGCALNYEGLYSPFFEEGCLHYLRDSYCYYSFEIYWIYEYFIFFLIL